jgi:hypothetical protein
VIAADAPSAALVVPTVPSAATPSVDRPWVIEPPALAPPQTRPSLLV